MFPGIDGLRREKVKGEEYEEGEEKASEIRMRQRYQDKLELEWQSKHRCLKQKPITG
jgi:hypothetical protein